MAYLADMGHGPFIRLRSWLDQLSQTMLIADDEEEDDENEEEGVGKHHHRNRNNNKNHRSGVLGAAMKPLHNHHHSHTEDGVQQRDGHHPIKTVSLHTLYQLAINHIANSTTHQPSSSSSRGNGGTQPPSHPSSSSFAHGSPLLEPEVKIGLGQLKKRYQRLLHGVQSFRAFDLDDDEDEAVVVGDEDAALLQAS